MKLKKVRGAQKEPTFVYISARVTREQCEYLKSHKNYSKKLRDILEYYMAKEG